MVDIVELGFRADSRELATARDRMRELGSAGATVSGNNETLERTNGTAARSFGLLGRAVAAVGFAALAREYISLADQYRGMNAGVSVVTRNTDAFRLAQVSLNQVARDARQPLQSVYSLYTNIAPSLEAMGREQSEVIKTTELISKALKTGGGDALGHAAALRQMTQALGSGVLRGDEFNSMMENGRGIAIQLAEGLDVPIGSLREMAAEGELTAEKVIDALLKQEREINEIYEQLPITTGEAWTKVENAVLLSIGKIDQRLNLASGWAGLIVAGAELVESTTTRLVGGIDAMVKAWADFKGSIALDDPPEVVLIGFLDAVADLWKQLPLTTQAAMAFAGSLTTLALASGAARLAVLSLQRAVLLARGAFVALNAIVRANPIVFALSLISAGAILVITHWDTLKRTVAESLAAIQARFTALKDYLGNIQWSWSGFRTAAIAAFNAVLTKFGQWVDKGRALFRKLWEKLPFVSEEAIAEATAGAGKTLVKLLSDEAVPAAKTSGKAVVEAVAEGMGITPGAKEAAKALGEDLAEATADGVDEAQKIQIALARSVNESVRTLDAQHIRLSEGAEAWRRYTLQNEQYKLIQDSTNLGLEDQIRLQAQADANVETLLELEARNKALAEQVQLRERFRDAISDSILQADSLKGAFDNLGDWLKRWLKEQIALFAANKLMVSVGLGTPSMGSGLGSLFNGWGAGGGSVPVPGPGEGSLLAAQSTAMGGAGSVAKDAGAGFMASITPALTTAAQVTAMALAANEIGRTFGQLTGGNERNAGIGAVLGGPLGAVAGAAMSTDFVTTNQGVDLAFNDGAVQGNSLIVQEKERSLWRGTKTRLILDDLDEGLAGSLENYFDTLRTDMGQEFARLGVDSATDLLAGFSLESSRFTGTAEQINDQINAWLSGATISAYEQATDSLGFVQQRYIDSVIAWESATVEQVQAAFDTLVFSAEFVTPVVQAIGVQFMTGSETWIAGWGARLTDLLGGVDVAGPLLTNFMNKIVPEAERLDFATLAAQQSLDRFNAEMGLTGDNAITTREDLLGFVRAQNAHTDAGAAAIAAAMGMADAVDTLASATESAAAEQAAAEAVLARVSTATGTLNLNFDQTSPLAISASESLVALMGGLTGFEQSVNSYYQEYFSEKEQEQLALAQAVAEVKVFSESLADAGVGAITSKDQFREYVESLDLTTEAGQRAFAAAMAVSDSFATVVDEAPDLQAFIDDLPPELRGAFEQMVLDAESAAGDIEEATLGISDDLGDVAGGISGLATAAGTAAGEIAGAIVSLRSDVNNINKPALTVGDTNIEPGNTFTEQDLLQGGYAKGSFAGGLSRVPYDGFGALLHADEMVLPKRAANILRGIDTGSPTASLDPAVAQLERRLAQIQDDAQHIADEQARLLGQVVSTATAQVQQLEQLRRGQDRLVRVQRVAE